MGLKFKVTTKDGNTYSAVKTQPLKRFTKDAEEEKKEELVLSEKEIKLLKELAEKSGDLLALLEKKGLDEDKKEKEEDKPKKDGKEEFEFEEEIEAKDEDIVDLPDEEDEESEHYSEEGLVEVDEDLAEVKDGCSTHDSKKSFGATESKRPIEDSLIDEQDEIFEAWANRYNKKGDNK